MRGEPHRLHRLDPRRHSGEILTVEIPADRVAIRVDIPHLVGKGGQRREGVIHQVEGEHARVGVEYLILNVYGRTSPLRSFQRGVLRERPDKNKGRPQPPSRERHSSSDATLASARRSYGTDCLAPTRAPSGTTAAAA